MNDEIKQSPDVSPTVAMFQKAHACLVTMQRIEEQIAALSDRRRRAQADLREAQAQLNQEIDRAAAPLEETAAVKMALGPRPRQPIMGGIAEAA
jgi:hypothetical protein